ncbi:hypothetical protein [Streptomyces sp. MAR4 CNX-425]|uniref:hypothetical protein n=1 Tax=Streptomyces sp. MAR4 CNX-425 TaxID=3406343 RepID=UPI003B51193B
MVHVSLPEIGLEGEWPVSEAERTVAAGLLAALPALPDPGADLAARGRFVEVTLRTVTEVIRENGTLLFGGRTGGVPEVPGRVHMIGMPFAIASTLTHVSKTRRLMLANRGAEAANAYLVESLARLEPEVVELRRLLAEAAEPEAGGA